MIAQHTRSLLLLCLWRWSCEWNHRACLTKDFYQPTEEGIWRYRQEFNHPHQLKCKHSRRKNSGFYFFVPPFYLTSGWVSSCPLKNTCGMTRSIMRARSNLGLGLQRQKEKEKKPHISNPLLPTQRHGFLAPKTQKQDGSFTIPG